MIRGLYTAAAGMMSTLTSNDTVADNIANINTTGFKRNSVVHESFPEMMLNRMTPEGAKEIGSITSGSKIHDTRIHFEQGGLHETGNTFDVALTGDGFFTVNGPKNPDTGEATSYYTRAGNFMVSEEGFLTTMNGKHVQGSLGDIQLNLDRGPFMINDRGELIAQDRVIDQIKVTRFEENNTLQKAGNALFQKTESSVEMAAPNPNDKLGYVMHQGKLERSNANPIGELVNMIQGHRLYETLQKNIQMHNQALGKAANDIAGR